MNQRNKLNSPNTDVATGRYYRHIEIHSYLVLLLSRYDTGFRLEALAERMSSAVFLSVISRKWSWESA